MKVSNPLTIIAIFAGLAETLATVALVNLPPEIQGTFVYFVMAFPSGIVLLFFYTLYFKNIVLYAPSDYDNQSHYLEANQIKDSVNNEVDKIFNEINKSGNRLTEDEIKRAKKSLGKSIDDATSLTKRELVLEFLTDNPSQSPDVAELLGITNQQALNILDSMKKRGEVSRHKESGDRRFTWTLNV